LQEIALLELDRGQVDRHLEMARPVDRHSCRFAQDPFADGKISPVSSAIGMKMSGPTTPRTGWCQRASAS
jgi:hypothetical protein